jgi:hypothetical protein
MIAEFEQRLADVLGSRLPAPFGGRVFVAPPGNPNQLRLVVGVERVTLTEPDMGSRRHERVPGANDGRRVVRASCTLRIDVQPGASAGRAQQVSALDAALYELEAPDFQSGEALVAPGDTGFVIQRMRCVGTAVPLDPDVTDAPPLGLTLEAEGLFWPVGVPGEAGIEIGEIRLRGMRLPLILEPREPLLEAGGPAVTLTLRVGRAGGHTIGNGVSALPIGNIAVNVFAPGGQPGAGVLSGGTAGASGARILDASSGEITFDYTPGAQPARDTLIASFEDGEGGPGVELGRFVLTTRAV